MSKNTSIAEKVRLQFRIETFNLANRVVFSVPSLNLSNSTQFGRISGQDNHARQIQLALKLEF